MYKSPSTSTRRMLGMADLRAQIPDTFPQARKDLYSALDNINLQNWLLKDAIYDGDFERAFKLIDGPKSAKDCLCFILKYENRNVRKGVHTQGLIDFWDCIRVKGMYYDKTFKTFKFS